MKDKTTSLLLQTHMDSSEYCLKASLNCGNAWENVCHALSQGSFFHLQPTCALRTQEIAWLTAFSLLVTLAGQLLQHYPFTYPFTITYYTQSTYYKILVTVSSMFYSTWRGCTYGGVYVTVYLLTSQVRDTGGKSGFCCCTCVTHFER